MIASCAFLGVLDHSVTFFGFLGTQLRFRFPSLGSFLEGSPWKVPHAGVGLNIICNGSLKV